jgi:hypothetical protein
LPIVFARIRVADVDSWKVAFLASEDVRRGFGLTTRAIYRDALYDRGLIVVLDAVTLDAAQDFFSSDEQRQRMARSGLERPAELWMGEPLPGVPGGDGA